MLPGGESLSGLSQSSQSSSKVVLLAASRLIFSLVQPCSINKLGVICDQVQHEHELRSCVVEYRQVFIVCIMITMSFQIICSIIYNY